MIDQGGLGDSEAVRAFERWRDCWDWGLER